MKSKAAYWRRAVNNATWWVAAVVIVALGPPLHVGTFALGALGPGLAQAAPVANSQSGTPAKTRQTARPWTGSPLGPDNDFEAPDRERSLRLTAVLEAMKIGPGSVVADIGAGGGWFTVRAARRVGPRGVVYAEEILPKYTNFIEQRARPEGLKNVRTILGTATDPRLPANTLDAVMILNAYHEFEAPLTMLRRIYLAMKPGARLAFIERDSPGLRSEARQAYARTGRIKRRVDEHPEHEPYTDDHRLAREIVEQEAAQAGFYNVTTMYLGDDNYCVIVARK